MTILQTVAKGVQASITWNNINISEEYSGSLSSGASGVIDLVGGHSATYEKIYTSQIWVHSIVNKLARGIGRLPLPVYGEGDESRERRREGALPDLLRRPWPRGTPFALKSAVVANLGVFGNCIAVPIRTSLERPPSELIPSSFRYWRPVWGKGTDQVDWWVFRSGTTDIPFRPDEVVHFMWWGTGADVIGASPIEALRTTLRLEDAAQRMHVASYDRAGRPSGAYTLDGNPTKETVEQVRAEVQKIYGGVDNAYRIAVMGGGAKWSPMSHSLNDSAIIETRKLTREECAAAYDMPPPVIQILDKATFSNISEQHLMLYMDTMGPWTTLIEETLQAQLIDPEPAFRGQYAEFNLNEVLKGDITKRYEAYQKAQWWMTPNEVRVRENMPPIEGDEAADRIHVPLSTTSAPPAEPSALAGIQGEDIHCPQCEKLLAKGVSGQVELYCDRCKIEVPIDNRKSAPA